MNELFRMEKLVGELLGLRLIVAQLLAREAQRSDKPEAMEEIRAIALETIKSWPISSDTSQGAERIRSHTCSMLEHFPGPTPMV